MRMILKNYEFFAGLLAAVALLIGVFGVKAPIWLSLVVAGVLFAGLFLIGSYQHELSVEQEARKLTTHQMKDKIDAGQGELARIREHIPRMAPPELKAKVAHICELADQIFDNFQADPSDQARASRFLLYLSRFLPLIERYARLSSTAAGRELLQKTGDDQEFRTLLDRVEEGFTKGLQNYLREDAAQMRTFGRVLKRMMDVAEIGK